MAAQKWSRLALAVTGCLSTGTAFCYTTGSISVIALKDLPAYVIQRDHAPTARSAFDAIVRPITAIKGLEQDAAWVPARLLTDPTQGDQIDALFANGVPLLITQEAGENYSSDIGAHFGASMNVSAAFYYRDQGGELQILAADSLLDDSNDGARLTRLAQTLAERRSTTATHFELAPSADIPMELPRFVVAATEIYPDGGSISILGMATRNSTTSSDAKVIAMKTRFVAPASGYSFVGGGFPQLTIPSSYRLTQGIQAFSASPILTDRYPHADGRTDVTLSEQKTTSTSYGFSISPELTNGLQDKVRATSAKLPFGFDFSKSFSESTSVTLTLKDYYLKTSATDNGQIQFAHWDVELAPFIMNTRGYFGRPFETSQAKVTPLMKGLDSEVFSTWALPGTFEDSIRLTSIYNTGYHRFAEPWSPAYIGSERPDIVTAVFIDGRSPFLTREITALIRSTSNNGCLAALPDSDLVGLQPCDASLDNYAQQWNLDSERRYRNRMDGRCMTVTTGDQVKLAPCSLSLDQKYSWVAERIHSLRDGDNQSLRLYSDGQHVRFEATAAQMLPPNPFHELISPWSSYPGAPQRSDIIPDPLPRVPRTIPEEWVTQYGSVPTHERWDVVVLRQGI